MCAYAYVYTVWSTPHRTERIYAHTQKRVCIYYPCVILHHISIDLESNQLTTCMYNFTESNDWTAKWAGMVCVCVYVWPYPISFKHLSSWAMRLGWQVGIKCFTANKRFDFIGLCSWHFIDARNTELNVPSPIRRWTLKIRSTSGIWVRRSAINPEMATQPLAEHMHVKSKGQKKTKQMS